MHWPIGVVLVAGILRRCLVCLPQIRHGQLAHLLDDENILSLPIHVEHRFAIFIISSDQSSHLLLVHLSFSRRGCFRSGKGSQNHDHSLPGGPEEAVDEIRRVEVGGRLGQRKLEDAKIVFDARFDVLVEIAQQPLGGLVVGQHVGAKLLDATFAGRLHESEEQETAEAAAMHGVVDDDRRLRRVWSLRETDEARDPQALGRGRILAHPLGDDRQMIPVIGFDQLAEHLLGLRGEALEAGQQRVAVARAEQAQTHLGAVRQAFDRGILGVDLRYGTSTLSLSSTASAGLSKEPGELPSRGPLGVYIAKR